MKERAGDLELINPCGRIPLIFQCSLGSRELPKWGLKISLCNREVQISHLPRAQVTPRTEAALLLWAKTPWILLFLVTESGGERAKIDYFSLELGLFGEHWELRVPALPKASSNEVTSAGHTGLSILSQHLVDVYPLFPFGSAALWDQLPV